MLSRRLQLALVTVTAWAGALIGALSGPALWGDQATETLCMLTFAAGALLALNALNQLPSLERFSPMLTAIAALVPPALVALPLTFLLKTVTGSNGFEFLYTWPGALAATFLLLVSAKGVAWSLTTRWSSDESRIVEIASLALVVLAVLPKWESPTQVESAVAETQAIEVRD